MQQVPIRSALPKWIQIPLAWVVGGFSLDTPGGKRKFIDTYSNRVAVEIKDFAVGSIALFWQRQAMYFGAALLAGYYFDASQAFICFAFCQCTELLDLSVALKVQRWSGAGARLARLYRRLMYATSLASSLAVAYFALTIARLEGVTVHFAPLFFLFAAGLFAAINNRQFPAVLYTRLLIYGAVFLFVPLRDIWEVKAPFESLLWMQFATVVFVLYFVVDCSIVFLRLYRESLDKLEELTLERDKAQAALVAKSQFVSTVSHELRTPLTSILGSLDLLRNGALTDSPEKTARVTQLAHQNGLRLATLINDILDVQRIESGKMNYVFRRVRLADCVIESMNSIAGMATARNIDLVLQDVDHELTIEADQPRLVQVISNLLSNAIKFSTDKLTVEVSIHEHDGNARVSVRDYGIGIPDNSEHIVFDRFSQIDLSDHRKYQGSGLGLSISQSIAEAHFGKVYYEKAPGEGTIFYLEIPLAQ
jgi:signal transduction histidine kinase